MTADPVTRPATTRRTAVALAVTVAASAAALTTVPTVVPRGESLHDALVAVALALGAGLLWVRARDEPPGSGGERPLWFALAAACGLVALGTTVTLVTPLGPSVRGSVVQEGRDVVIGLAVLLAFLMVYQGLIRWNRYAGLTADPSDWLNGIGGVLAATAVGNLVISWTGGPLADLPWWLLQGSLLRVSGVAVLLGTVGTVAALGNLRRDVRLWAVGVAVAVVGAGEAAGLAALGSGVATVLPLTAWGAAGAVLASAALRPPARARARQATTRGPTAGALVVLVVSVTVLVLDGGHLTGWLPLEYRSGGHIAHLPTMFALAAALVGSVRVGRLVSDLSQLAQSQHEARTDDLTGIANRRALMSVLAERVEREDPTCLLVIDLDRFKEVNDRHGHAVGDSLLRSLAARLGEVMPGGSLLARLGGDEFAVVVVGDEDAGLRVAQDLAEVAASPVEVAGHRVRVTASIGVASTGPGTDAEELLRRSDAAMFRAKATGSGTASFDIATDRAARARTRLLEELRSLLSRPEEGPVGPPAASPFVVHYQPQLDLRTDQVTGVEALVRWRHPRLGLLAPAEFIDLVEAHGLMGPLTSSVLWQAAEQAVRWQSDGRHLRLAVNVSTSFLTDAALLRLLDEVVAETGIDPSRLVVEVTESTLMVDAERGLQAARAIRSRGVGLSIDDYGTGYSSLAYLNDLPATELKLDRSFISRLLEDERTAAIVAATVSLAQRLGLRLVAEGVEDEATLAELRRLGCDVSQGYVHSRPLPAAELDMWLGRSSGTGARVTVDPRP